MEDWVFSKNLFDSKVYLPLQKCNNIFLANDFSKVAVLLNLAL
jgi:hypothetical protein